MIHRYYCRFEKKWHVSHWGYIKVCHYCNNMLFRWAKFLKGDRHV